MLIWGPPKYTETQTNAFLLEIIAFLASLNIAWLIMGKTLQISPVSDVTKLRNARLPMVWSQTD